MRLSSRFPWVRSSRHQARLPWEWEVAVVPRGVSILVVRFGDRQDIADSISRWMDMHAPAADLESSDNRWVNT
jgi:hypothetical protein